MPNSNKFIFLAGAIALLLIIFFTLVSSATYIIQPGDRGVMVTLGKADPLFKPEGLGFKPPLISDVFPVSVKVQSATFKSECFSSDLQQVTASVTVNFHIAENQVVKIYTQYAANLIDGIIEPRTQEALKEHTAARTAEEIVKQREQVKEEALAALKLKVQDIVTIDDLVIQDVTLSPELEQAIEAKMTQQQRADQAKFTQEQTRTEAETAVIEAEGQAKAIEVQGEALAKTPQLIQLKIVEKWDGHSPIYVGGSGGGANLLLPIEKNP
jgi:prohibitin 2